MAIVRKFVFPVQMVLFVFAKRVISGKIMANYVATSTNVLMNKFVHIIATTRMEVISAGAHLVTLLNQITTPAKPPNDLHLSL